jgi:YidC/Oxa1 family membrane protein insertase
MQTQQPDNQKNLLLAIILSVGVLFFWQVFYANPKLKEEQERLKRQKEVATQQAPVAPGAAPGPATGAPVVVGQPSTTPGPATAAPAPTPTQTRAQALAATPRVAIDNPALKGSIALKGGRIDDLLLKNYRETVQSGSPNIVIYSPREAADSYFAEYGWTAAAGSTPPPLPGPDTLWSREGAGSLTPATPVTLAWSNGQGLEFKRTISVDASFMFKIVDSVANKTGSEVTLYPYARIYRFGIPKIEGFFIQHEGLVGVIGDARLQELTYSDVQKDGGGKTYEKKTGGWLGFTDKYWATAMIPDQSLSYTARMDCIRAGKSCDKSRGKEAFQADYFAADGLAVPAGQTRSVEAHLFAGAKQVGLIGAYEKSHQVKDLSYLIDWGWFYFITKPMYQLIHWLFGLFKNFGLAILAVTVLVKLAFFPLANKSYESMARMKKLQPEMERIRDRYKDDKAAQQKELMALYQKEKVNPMAGCLPILLQIPVFFALYKVLFVTLDMRHAPFFGWIKDLSAADPTSLFNLFGLLPFGVPEFLQIGIWPLIMGVTMWVQMQLNPQNPDPVQQQIFNWMPVMFTFMLGTFPAGLVIYWAWNNVLSIIQQAWIMKKNGVDNPLWKNLGLARWLKKPT